MCAIAGMWTALRASEGLRGPSPLVQKVTAMLEIQKHRGTEPNSVWTEGGLVLGHRRLAILDLSEAGRQPMRSRDGRWTIVFNGEIFNYRELRTALRERIRGGFTTATDTEVLIEACAAWGVEGALARVHGMFAFGLWDRLRRELTLARDRAGEKPLVYFWDGATLAFASELKALEGLHARRLDRSAVDAYLTLGYVPAPLAIFEHCHKLPAGHLVRFHAAPEGGGPVAGGHACIGHDGHPPVPHRWWRPEASAENCASRADCIDQLRARVGESVRLRLRADVPVAISLSGGLDSSVIAAECARQGSSPEAFTVSFDGDETDLPFARQVAARFHLPHRVLRATPAALAGRMDEIVFHYDEPFADSSALACFALAEAVGESYRVVLDGDGGDEAFGGYRHYEYIGWKQTYKAVAAAAGWCDGGGGGRAALYVQSKSLFRTSERRRMMARSGGSQGPLEFPACDAARASADRAARWWAERSWMERVQLDRRAGGTLHQALRIDRELALANGLTYKMDVAMGAFAVEGRAPLLDHAVLEWGQALPARELVRGRDKKILLRAAYAGELPREVLDRPKHGFGAPVDRWLAGPFRKLARELIPCPWFESSLPRDAAGQRKWALLMFAAWARRWNATW